MTKSKVGIVGVGKLGNYHCNSLSQRQDAELVGVYDIDKEQRDKTAKKYHCRSFENSADLVSAVDVVGVIVPTSYHSQVTRMAIEAGKPVFVEKPIAAGVAEAEEMVRFAEQKHVPLQVGHIERFNPAIRALNGFALRPQFIESHRLAPFDPRGTDVAVVLDLMIHDIDIILSLVKSNPVHIDASGVAVVSDEVDIANARLQFENGCVANVTSSRISQRKMRKMRLFQRDSYISIDFLQKLTEIFRLQDAGDENADTVVLGQIDKGKHRRHIIYDKPETPDDDAMHAEWTSFFNAIKKGTRPIVSGEDGLNALRVATEITNLIAGRERSYQKT
ncbi:MAG: Gfo/Idh/MocA family oxidoreductase [Actinobacteria bacterium]|nr:Gfo/Idh/MocA family oxidoreductase [Actinomycetota bacterium]